jgi:hypothetical protein
MQLVTAAAVVPQVRNMVTGWHLAYHDFHLADAWCVLEPTTSTFIDTFQSDCCSVHHSLFLMQGRRAHSARDHCCT